MFDMHSDPFENEDRPEVDGVIVFHATTLCCPSNSSTSSSASAGSAIGIETFALAAELLSQCGNLLDWEGGLGGAIL